MNPWGNLRAEVQTFFVAGHVEHDGALLPALRNIFTGAVIYDDGKVHNAGLATRSTFKEA